MKLTIAVGLKAVAVPLAFYSSPEFCNSTSSAGPTPCAPVYYWRLEGCAEGTVEGEADSWDEARLAAYEYGWTDMPCVYFDKCKQPHYGDNPRLMNRTSAGLGELSDTP